MVLSSRHGVLASATVHTAVTGAARSWTASRPCLPPGFLGWSRARQECPNSPPKVYSREDVPSALERHALLSLSALFHRELGQGKVRQDPVDR